MPNPSRIIGSYKNETQKDSPITRTNHLLVIGVDEYKNSIPPLNNAVRDANAFYKELTGNYQFEEKNARTLFNNEASKDNILEAFDDFLGALTDKDNLVIYFSGHGELHDKTNRGYWIPADARLEKRGSYLSNNELIDFFNSCDAHHIFTIVDSCFSGALFQTRNLSSAEERMDRYPSRWLLTAGRKELVSDGSLGKNSPFATALLTKLKLVNGQTLWVSDLCNHIKRVVPFNSKQTPRGEPLQNVGHQGGEFVFYRKGYIPEVNPISNEEKIENEVTKSIQNEPESTPEIPKPQTIFELKTQLKLQLGELEEVFKILNEILNPASKLFNDIILQQARFNSANNQLMSGFGDEKLINRTFNHIRHSLTSYIDKMKESDLKKEHLPKSDETSTPKANDDDFLQKLNQIEDEGLKSQAKLLVEKLNMLEDALILEDDPSRKFKYKKQIEQAKEQLEGIKKQLNF